MSHNPPSEIRSWPPWVEVAKVIVEEDCSFPQYHFHVSRSHTGAVYLQATYKEEDTKTGVIEIQHTRRWFLSPEMSRSEIVSTAFKCALTSMEHRTREWFVYRGRAIYQPHYDVDALHRICEERDTRKTAEAL